MAAYRRPGVYVVETPLRTQTPQVTGETAVAFIGEAPRGPITTPTFINSWAAYKAIYGDPDQDYDLGFAVYHFFTNGGASCWVNRVLTSNATPSTLALIDAGNFTLTSKLRGTQGNNLSAVLSEGTDPGTFDVEIFSGATRVEEHTGLNLTADDPNHVATRLNHAVNGSRYVTVSDVTDGAVWDYDPAVTVTLAGGVDNGATEASVPITGVTAVGPARLFTLNARNLGAWGNNMTVTVTAGQVTATATRLPTFSMVVTLNGQEVERWSELTVDPAGSRYVETILNNYSTYLRVSDVAAVTPTGAFTYTIGTFSFLGGTNGAAVTNDDFIASLGALDVIEGDLLINAPGIIAGTVINAILGYARTRGNGFVVIDPDPDADTTSEIINNANTFSTAPGYGAVYYPAAVMFDPTKTGPGALRLTAPGGAILGTYVRSDRQRSVAKAPAGYDADIKGVFALHRTFTEAQVGTLYANHVNVLRTVPGVGVIVNGARTLERSTPDMYIPIRRSMNFVKARISEVTAFAVFEPNDERLWDTIKIRANKELTAFWSRGGLKGNTAEDAFYVLCDATNNTAASIAEGVVNVEVGLALQYPAEFIVITISQWSGGTSDVATGA